MVKMSYYADYSNYTDWHDVDEETRTAIAHGGYWCRENEDGVTRLNLDGWNTPTTTRDIVTSRCCTIQTKKNKHHSPSNEGE